jgi:fructoselysine 6-kinase
VRIIGIGDNVVDDYTHIKTIFPGGNALNVAVYASMLGRESAYLGVFGTDQAAEHVKATLAEKGVDSSRCRAAHGPNGRATLTIKDGERMFTGSNAGGVSKSVPMDFIFDDIDYLRSYSVAHTSAYSYMDDHLARLKSLVPLISYDFSDDFDTARALSLCEHVDIAFFSCAEWTAEKTMEFLERSQDRGCTLAAATRGPREAILFDGQRWYRAAPLAVTPIDTLGAGDAFICGFLVNYVGGFPDRGGEPSILIDEALHKAVSFAGEICQVQGAFGHGLRY